MSEKDRLCFSLKLHEGNHFFRDIRPSFGRTRISSRQPTGAVVASTCLPGQMLMIFDDKDPDREHRLVIGRENLFLQGFPIDLIEGMQGT